MVETTIWTEVALACISIAMAAWLGWFLGKGMGVFFLTTLTVIASGLCIAIAAGLGWSGLLVAMLLIAALGARLGYALSKRRGALMVLFLWLWFCMIFLLIHKHGDWVGLFTIALPSFILLWAGLFFLSDYLLPPQEAISDLHWRAFRSLLTFTLGTNYPYFVIEDWKRKELTPRVNGNIFSQFFAGPGIILTSCDHLVTIFDGVKFRGARPPGLTFTERYERIDAVVDLRPQLRVTTIKAETKDGIPISVLIFVPFRINAGDRTPKLGNSYPFDRNAVFRAVHEQPVVSRWGRDQQGRAEQNTNRLPWDDLATMVASPLLKDVIVDYTCDGLCGEGDPRLEIRSKFRKRIREELEPCGIQVLGGGLSNILPADENIVQQRIKNWRADWERKIAIKFEKRQAEVTRRVEAARRKTLVGVMRCYADILTHEVGEGMSEKVMALRLIEALEEMTREAAVRQKLSAEGSEGTAVTPEVWQELRRRLK